MSEPTFQEMVERVSWMSPIDYEILEFFDSHDIQASPQVISANIGYDRNYTGKRCRNFTEYNILERHENGLYELTDDGRSFLAGEIDADELDEPE